MLFNKAMKNKTPQVAANNLWGYLSHAITHMSLDKAILSQLQGESKVQNGLSFLQYRLQEVR